MIQGRCPTCGKAFEAPSLDAWPAFPFCSPRSQLIDLGRWIDEAYTVPETEEENSTSEPGPIEGD